MKKVSRGHQKHKKLPNVQRVKQFHYFLCMRKVSFLTLGKNCSRRHFHSLLLPQESKHADDQHEMSLQICSFNQEMNDLRFDSFKNVQSRQVFDSRTALSTGF